MDAADPTENLSFYNEEMEQCASDYAAYVLELVAEAKKTCKDSGGADRAAAGLFPFRQRRLRNWRLRHHRRRYWILWITSTGKVWRYPR